MNAVGAGPASVLGRGTGWVPDLRREVGSLPALAKSRPLVGAAQIPETWTWLADRAPVWDQGATNSCVAYAIAEAVWLFELMAGRQPFLIDIDVLYKMARQRGQKPSDELHDVGCFPEDAVAAAAEDGVIHATLAGAALQESERDLTRVDPTTVNQKVYLDEVQAAASHLVGGWRRVDDGAPGLIEEMQYRHIVLQQQPIVGIDLCEDFPRYTSGLYHRRVGAPSIGRHMVTPVGWTQVDGELGFICLVHYGRGTGVGGKVVIAASTMAGPYVSDRTHLTVRPR